jgi:Arc/MetJ-type ribon-helix-helix transcriptional regulator
MAAGGYATEDELLLDALRALRYVELSRKTLRDEIQERLDRTGKPAAEPLDFDAFRAELHASRVVR